MINQVTVEDLRAALRARDRESINAIAATLLDQRVALADQWFPISQVLLRTGELTLAMSAARRGVEECGEGARARLELAHVLAGAGHSEEALALAAEIPAGEVDAVDLSHFLGTCAMELGDFERAEAMFSDLVRRWPGAGPSWLSLSSLPPADDADLLARLDGARSAMDVVPPEYRAQWHYARGAVLDRLDRHDEAFAEFAAGAAIIRDRRPYDATADRDEAQALIATYGREAIARIGQAVSVPTDRPIFVTGLPRSGTTLVEQILASHSEISGGGEAPFGAILVRDVGGRSLDRLEAFVHSNGADKLAKLYLHLGDERFGPGRRFVDKSLQVSRDLGILASTLPQARFIWLRRDPLDCAWSCFRTYFSGGIEWSWALEDIANHFRAEDALFAHWRDALGERLLSQPYEELASDPRGQVARIVDHLGLEAEADLEAAPGKRRAVKTASVAQVRKPVHQAAIGSAEPYREHLQPFVRAYEG